jgi:hypothetical protein
MPVQVGVAIAAMLGFSSVCISATRSEYNLCRSEKHILSFLYCTNPIAHIIFRRADNHPELEKTRTAEWKAAAKSLPNPLRDPEGKFR